MSCTQAASADILPGLVLSDQQQAGLAALEAFVQSEERIFLLTGYAGTGKTTLLQALLTRLRHQGDRRRVAFTALSNKATKVLAAMADRWDLAVDCMTCCRLLGLRPVIDKDTGQQNFTADSQRKALIHYYRLVVVDECSMINQEMWLLLVQAISDLSCTTQLLFVGDPAQLPPVHETRSLCFDQIYARFDLTDVVRYGGAIGLLADSVRQRLDQPILPSPVSQSNPNHTEGVFVVPRATWEQLLQRAFTSATYAENPDQVRVLAYTNHRVQNLNQQIRQAIYGSTLARFVVGERLIAHSPCLQDESIILQTSEECQVLDITPGQVDQWQVWHLEVETETGQMRQLQVLHEAEAPRLKTQLQHLAAAREWRLFWSLKQRFHEVHYSYCLTVHKSQGSTFQDVFIDWPNLRLNRRVTERNQLYYVAVTRAARRLFIPQ
ncbi:ATP-dependent DNA helicase [Lyngbya confervoides]|uniref:AAA family ATPase n=1 Tax=Lyngbya confervoides BDU141951 TaxID=1574623 RepID=A0ABD4T239_9CYAN|nr:AAA family ATPase [Lyngbya confervoides]MCM1982802.1 AAA family ATPase [Lyngbya confervoides BDU141951]